MRPIIWILGFLILSGWAGQLMVPIIFASQPDETSVIDGKPCRGTKTIFDTDDTPSCFGKVADDLAKGGRNLPAPNFGRARGEDEPQEEPPLD